MDSFRAVEHLMLPLDAPHSPPPSSFSGHPQYQGTSGSSGSSESSEFVPLSQEDMPHVNAEQTNAEEAEAADAAPESPGGGKYKTRICRICFDEVQPTFEPLTTTAQLLGQQPRVRYVSEDPECGRLMRPCKCKGTQKYVHEGCLRAWRMAAGADRNLWTCPTCLYQYKLNRLSWGAWVSSTVVRGTLTLVVLVLSVFLLGFIAEPLLNFVDPGMFLASFTDDFEDLEDWIPEDQPDTWSWHFTRGFFALGVMGVFKSFIALRPWHAWNIRVGGGGRRRRGGGLEDISWVMVLFGVAMFLRVSDA